MAIWHILAWNGSEFVVAWAQATEWQWWQVPAAVPQGIHAVRVGPDAVLRDPVPLVLWDEPHVVITRMQTAPSAGGIAVVWQTEMFPGESGSWNVPVGGKTYAARFEGSERPPAHVLSEPQPRSVRALTALGGKVLVIWGAGTATSQYALLSPALQTEATGAVPVPPDDLDVASLRGVPVLAYARIAREPESGGVHRVFVRTAAEMPRKRRAVR